MELLKQAYVKASEFHRGLSKGQTMTEYALILSAVAVVVFAAYNLMGTDISTLLGTIDTYL
jgi:Flp pilus assembly pilin Flp